MEFSNGVLLQILVRVVEAETDVCIRRQMKNKIASRHRADQRGQIQTIAFDEFEFGIG